MVKVYDPAGKGTAVSDDGDGEGDELDEFDDNDSFVLLIAISDTLDTGNETLHLSELFWRSPMMRPRQRASITAVSTDRMMHILFQPPLLAMYLLFLTSNNFSPFGPVTSHTEYFGGGFSKLCRGGSPRFHLRLNGRLWVSGIGGIALSSTMTESLASLDLKWPRFAECFGEYFGRGGCCGEPGAI